jgi:hypothetical protein
MAAKPTAAPAVHVAAVATNQKNTVVTKGVAIPDVTKTATYAESVSDNGGSPKFVEQFRATQG